MGRSTMYAAASVAAILSACGTTTSKASEEPGASSVMNDAPFVITSNGEVMVSCGRDSGWAPSLMARGIPGVLSQDEATQIFQTILDDPRTGGEAGLTLFRDGVDVEWRVLSQEDTPSHSAWGHGPNRGQAKGHTPSASSAKAEHGGRTVGGIANCLPC